MTTDFTSRPQRRAEKAFVSFCALMRSRSPYRASDWDKSVWVVGKGRRASARSLERIHFTRHAFASAAELRTGEAFDEPFASFVKAAIVWRAVNASKTPTAISQMVLVRAFRYLYEVLVSDRGIEGAFSSTVVLKARHFNSAAADACKRESPHSAYRIASHLKSIADLVDRFAMTHVPLRWSHGVDRPENAGGMKQDRIGSDFHRRRNKLLPTDEILYAISDISNRGDLDPADKIRQRGVDVLFCCGFRINEMLTLERDALVEEPVLDDLGQLATDANGSPLPPYLGIRFSPEKEGESVTGVKWIPSDLAPVARRAFSDVLEMTDEYARDAEFAHFNPGRVRLGEPWDSLDATALLSSKDCAALLGLKKQYATTWLKDNGVPRVTIDGSRLYAKGDVEEALRRRMVKSEVSVGGSKVPLHKMLFVVPVNFFHSDKASLKGTATLVTDQNISDYLVGRGVDRDGRTKSIFERLGVVLANGKTPQIRSHQFRHFLDTAAASGGLPELVRARWMGRKDISQNSAYDHESGISLANKIRIRLIEGGVIGPISEITDSVSDPVARQVVAGDLLRAVHKTMLGRCFHDWSSSPCPEHEACWSCDEHFIVKGDVKGAAEAERQFEEAVQAIAIAEAAKADGAYGANNWLSSHVRKRDRLLKILDVHRDPSIADGSIVHLGRSGSTAQSSDSSV
jgi:hypothetical protein